MSGLGDWNFFDSLYGNRNFNIILKSVRQNKDLRRTLI